MNSITQDILYKQSVVKYSYKYGVTKVAKPHLFLIISYANYSTILFKIRL